MKLLVITRSPWDDTNSTGNTMTNIWSGWNYENIANIYCRAAVPNNEVCHLYYSISEKDLLGSIVNRKHNAGKSFTWTQKKDSGYFGSKDSNREEQLYEFFRKNSFVIALWGRELLWKLGNWENRGLDRFLADFQPDIIFSPCFAASYTHELLWYVQEKTQAKVVLFHADDYLTVKELGGSPLSIINRRLRARTVTKSARKADLNYCISPKQQEEYSKHLKSEMRLLYKGADFNVQPDYKRDKGHNLIRIVYVGSTLYGRWKTLGMLARAICKVNADRPIFELMIYSQYQPSVKAERTMVIDGASRFMGKIPAAQVPNILSDADIVLHVESFDRKERIATRLSFSTKIVDCLHSGRCVFAIGWKEAASIEYLINNDAALVATDEITTEDNLRKVANTPAILVDYAQKAWECGKRNHQIDMIRRGLNEDMARILTR